MKVTILGGSGFIGRALVRRLHAHNAHVYAPGRGDVDWKQDLGHVIYAIGLTADFRTRAFETVEAHVEVLSEFLRRARYDSLLYLSSTRVYRGARDTSEESSLVVSPSDGEDLYNLSKLLGESLCLAVSRPTVRVVRLSNVYGPGATSDDFLTSVLREAAGSGAVQLRTAMDSERDFVDLADVVDLLPRIADSGRHRLYNVGSGCNITNRQLADALARLNVRVSVEPGAQRVAYPPLRIARVVEEFGFEPRQLLPQLPGLYADYVARAGLTGSRGARA